MWIWRKFDAHLVVFAMLFTIEMAGINRDAIIAMIAITTRSSMSVKADRGAEAMGQFYEIAPAFANNSKVLRKTIRLTVCEAVNIRCPFRQPDQLSA
jgi:hypothetical protein